MIVLGTKKDNTIIKGFELAGIVDALDPNENPFADLD